MHQNNNNTGDYDVCMNHCDVLTKMNSGCLKGKVLLRRFIKDKVTKRDENDIFIKWLCDKSWQ